MAADNDERKALVKSRKEYTLLLFKDLQHDIVFQELFPCCMDFGVKYYVPIECLLC